MEPTPADTKTKRQPSTLFSGGVSKSAFLQSTVGVKHVRMTKVSGPRFRGDVLGGIKLMCFFD